LVENSVETFKDVVTCQVQLNICEKKRKQFFIAKGKKKQALFSKRFVSNTLSNKQKELRKLLFQKASIASFGLQQQIEKKKNKALCRKSCWKILKFYYQFDNFLRTGL
jgi:hypothetical protein